MSPSSGVVRAGITSPSRDGKPRRISEFAFCVRGCSTRRSIRALRSSSLSRVVGMDVLLRGIAHDFPVSTAWILTNPRGFIVQSAPFARFGQRVAVGEYWRPQCEPERLTTLRAAPDLRLGRLP